MAKHFCECGRPRYIYSKNCLACHRNDKALKANSAITLDAAKKLFLTEKSHRKIKHSCVACGKVRILEYRNAIKIQRCAKCRNESQKGSSHPMWGNPGMRGTTNPNYNYDRSDARRAVDRKLSGDFTWSKDLKRKYGYRCALCRDSRGGNLVSHHLNSWDTFPDLRQASENGVCLCSRCHKRFHYEFGYGKNTLAQFRAFSRFATPGGGVSPAVKNLKYLLRVRERAAQIRVIP